MKRLIITIFGLYCPSFLLSQFYYDNREPISPTQFAIQHYSEFPEARAVILLSKGRISFDDVSGGYNYVMHHWKKIQMLSDDVEDLANQFVAFYARNDIEGIQHIKAFTHNLVDGKVETIELGKEHIVKDEQTEWRHVVKMAFPKVKKGTIIEFMYTLRSKDVAHPRPWYFQAELPTIRNELEFFIFPRFDFTYFLIGNLSANVKEYEPQKWRLMNVPALEDESYSPELTDFFQRIVFQLRGYNYAGQYKPYHQSWEEYNKELWNDKDMGKQLKSNKHLQLPNHILTDVKDGHEKLEKIYVHVREYMSWNGKVRRYLEDELEKVYENRQGNSAEINLLLTYFLREANLEAYPILIGTRDYGMMIKDYPLTTQFNKLLCYVKIDEQDYLIDATNPLRPYSYPSSQDLNGSGFKIDEKNGEWIDFKDNNSSYHSVQGMFHLTEDGTLSGSITENLDGFYALRLREKMYQRDENDILLKDRQDGIDREKISDLAIDYVEEPERMLELKYVLDADDFIGSAGDLFYLDPLMFFKTDQNPFQANERELPIDFGFGWREVIAFTVILPSNIEVAELPEQAWITIPGKAGSFKFMVQDLGNAVQIRSEMQIRQAYYGPDAYPVLKELYEQKLLKHAAKIVLKRKT